MSAAITFDTHELIKKLKESGFNEEQAEGLSTALKEVQESQLEELATKHDIKELRHEIRELELKMDNKFTELESEMKSEFKLIKWGIALIIAVVLLPALKGLIY